MKKKTIIATIILIAIVISSLTFVVLNYSNSLKLKQDNEILLTILKANTDMGEVSIISQKADMFYDLSGLCYEREDYSCVESNCLLAREYFMDEVTSYRKIKAELELVDHELTKDYGQFLTELIVAKESMFEACEHFESAARYYSNDNYEMGGLSIDSMNEKILQHDESIRRYNTLLEEFNVKLEQDLAK